MAIKVKVYNQKAEPVSEMDLSEKVFGLKVNPALIHQAAVAQASNERQVLAHTKTKSEVRGGGKKPWRQKGTGRARAGSSRSPIWIGGGVTFGPRKDRNFKKKINRKMKQNAMMMAISDRLHENAMAIIDEFVVTEYKTKIVNDTIRNIEKAVLNKEAKEAKRVKRSILILTDAKDEKTKYSTRNLAGVKFLNLENINLLDLLQYKNLVITKSSVEKLEALYKK